MPSEVTIEDQLVMPVDRNQICPVRQVPALYDETVIAQNHVARVQFAEFVQDGLGWDFSQQAVTWQKLYRGYNLPLII